MDIEDWIAIFALFAFLSIIAIGALVTMFDDLPDRED